MSLRQFISFFRVQERLLHLNQMSMNFTEHTLWWQPDSSWFIHLSLVLSWVQGEANQRGDLRTCYASQLSQGTIPKFSSLILQLRTAKSGIYIHPHTWESCWWILQNNLWYQTFQQICYLPLGICVVQGYATLKITYLLILLPIPSIYTSLLG